MSINDKDIKNSVENIFLDPSLVGWEFVPGNGDQEKLKTLIDDPKSDIVIEFRKVSTNQNDINQPKAQNEKKENDERNNIAFLFNKLQDKVTQSNLVRIVLCRTKEKLRNNRTTQLNHTKNKPLTLFMLFKNRDFKQVSIDFHYNLLVLISATNLYLSDHDCKDAPKIWENSSFNDHQFLGIQFEGIRFHFVQKIFQRLLKIEIFQNRNEMEFFKNICGFKKNTKVEQELLENYDNAENKFIKILQNLKNEFSIEKIEENEKENINSNFKETLNLAKIIHEKSIELNEINAKEYLTINNKIYSLDEMNILLELGNKLEKLQCIDFAIQVFESIGLNSPYYSTALRHCSELYHRLANLKEKEEDRKNYLQKSLLTQLKSMIIASDSLLVHSSTETEWFLYLIELYLNKFSVQKNGFFTIMPGTNLLEFFDNLTNVLIELSDKIREQNNELEITKTTMDIALHKQLQLPKEELKKKIEKEATTAKVSKESFPNWKKISGDMEVLLDPKSFAEIEFEWEGIVQESVDRNLRKVILMKSGEYSFTDKSLGNIVTIPSSIIFILILQYPESHPAINQPFALDLEATNHINSACNEVNFGCYMSKNWKIRKKFFDDHAGLIGHSYLAYDISQMRSEIRDIFFKMIDPDVECFASLNLGKSIVKEESDLLNNMELCFKQGNYDRAIEIASDIHTKVAVLSTKDIHGVKNPDLTPIDDSDAAYRLGMALIDVSPLHAARCFMIFEQLSQNNIFSIYKSKALFALRDIFLKLVEEGIESQEKRKFLKVLLNIQSLFSGDIGIYEILSANCGYNEEQQKALFSKINHLEDPSFDEFLEYIVKIMIVLLDKISENELLLENKVMKKNMQTTPALIFTNPKDQSNKMDPNIPLNNANNANNVNKIDKQFEAELENLEKELDQFKAKSNV